MQNAIDTAAVTELVLCTENEGTLHPLYKAICANLARKVEKGTYDATLAPKAFAPFVDAGAKLYAKQNGGVWHELFPADVRREACKRFAADWQTE